MVLSSCFAFSTLKAKSTVELCSLHSTDAWTFAAQLITYVVRHRSVRIAGLFLFRECPISSVAVASAARGVCFKQASQLAFSSRGKKQFACCPVFRLEFQVQCAANEAVQAVDCYAAATVPLNSCCKIFLNFLIE